MFPSSKADICKPREDQLDLITMRNARLFSSVVDGQLNESAHYRDFVRLEDWLLAPQADARPMIP